MNDPSWTDVLQTIAIVLALIFTAWEMRARTREQKFHTYMDAILNSVDLAKLMIEKPELHALYDYSATDWTKQEYGQLNSEEKALVHYCDTIIALCETVWLAGQQGWLSPDEWPYWKRWTDQLDRSPAFRWTVSWVKEDYDEVFLSRLRSQVRVVESLSQKRV
jgi:hypothetical protein